jgi:FkbM family methyltransferase
MHLLLKKFCRRLTASIKRKLSCPDAWADILDLLRADAQITYCDIGAHIGETVERIHSEVPNRILAFEPTPSSFKKLQSRFPHATIQEPGTKNQELKTKNQELRKIFLIPLAISDSCRKATFWINSNEQTNSLCDNAEGNKSSFTSATQHKEALEVQVVSFDAWATNDPFQSPKYFFKLDVQGEELRALQGANESLARAVGVYAECPLEPMYENQAHFWEIHQFLLSKGFYLRNLYPCFHDPHGRAVQTDALWLREEKP